MEMTIIWRLLYYNNYKKGGGPRDVLNEIILEK